MHNQRIRRGDIDERDRADDHGVHHRKIRRDLPSVPVAHRVQSAQSVQIHIDNMDGGVNTRFSSGQCFDTVGLHRLPHVTPISLYYIPTYAAELALLI